MPWSTTLTLKVVIQAAPTNAELATGLCLPRRQHVKSNTIVYAKDRATAASGRPDEPCRFARIAARKAQDARRKRACRRR